MRFATILFLSTSLFCCTGVDELSNDLNTSSIVPLGFTADIDIPDEPDLRLNVQSSDEFSIEESERLGITNLYSHGYVTERAFGPELNLLLSRKLEPIELQEPFINSFRFWDDSFLNEDGSAAPDAMLREYFTIGRTFPVGVGPGMVRFGILLPTSDQSRTNYRSTTDITTEVDGFVSVIDVQVFSNAQFQGLSEEIYLITFSYDLAIGIYNAGQDEATGPPLYNFTSKSTARVTGISTLKLTGQDLE